MTSGRAAAARGNGSAMGGEGDDEGGETGDDLHQPPMTACPCAQTEIGQALRIPCEACLFSNNDLQSEVPLTFMAPTVVSEEGHARAQ